MRKRRNAVFILMLCLFVLPMGFLGSSASAQNDLLEVEKFDDELPSEDFESIDGEVFADEFTDITEDPDISGDIEEILTDEPVLEEAPANEPVIEANSETLPELAPEIEPEVTSETLPVTPEMAPVEVPYTDPAMEVPGTVMGGGEFVGGVMGSGPDEALENRLHEIFEKYNKIPISNDEWAEIAGAKQKETYSVSEGDSLWQISEMFFGDGNYWPKVWSFNSRITNPHVIEISDRILFLPGDEENAPKVVVESQQVAEVAQAPVEAPAKAIYDDSGGVLNIPNPTKSFRPVLKSIPPSLPQDQSRFDQEFDESGFAVSTKRFAKPQVADMKLTSFITETYPEGRGDIVEIMGGRNTAQLYEYVYVKMDSGDSGGIYTVISKFRKGVGGNEIEFDDAFVVEYQGEIEVRERVNSEENIYRALVISQVNPITLGSRVVTGSIPKVSVSNLGRVSAVKTEIVGGEFDVGRSVLGTGSVVYLNAGSEAGLEPGSIVGVVANEKLRNENTRIEENLRTIGRVKVAKVEPTLATGIVVYATDAILTDDLVSPTVSELLEPMVPGDDGFSEDFDDDLDSDGSTTDTGSLTSDLEEDLDDDFGDEEGALALDDEEEEAFDDGDSDALNDDELDVLEDGDSEVFDDGGIEEFDESDLEALEDGDSEAFEDGDSDALNDDELDVLEDGDSESFEDGDSEAFDEDEDSDEDEDEFDEDEFGDGEF